MNFGQEFRAEAIEKTGDTVFRTVQGWRFGLSYGHVRTATREEFEHVKSGRGSAFANKTAKPLTDKMSYEEYVERSEAAGDKLKMMGFTDRTWVLSASLWPRGRSSTTRDWDYLGQMLGAVGVPDPKRCCLTPIETTHPNDVHYWQWEEPKAEEKN